ncbi:MAG: anaerobic glycerol-3-phosphate dehydrogenase subunit C [Caldilineaceae bacterium]|nr:anaerobic glycerol-3-phosphate dehydrogenase subunit C [Caldilineaceae bacterium]
MQNTTVNSVGLSLNACIKCNICTSYCPVSEVTDSFPGPKYAAPQSERFRDFGHPHYEDAAGHIARTLAAGQMPDASVDYCSGCRVCNEVCPTGVRIAEINARARARIVAARGLSLRNRLLGRNELLGRMGSIQPGLANFLLHNPLSRKLAASLFGIAEKAPLPRWHHETLNRWLARTRAQRLRSERKVVYFHGCATQYYEPFVGMAAILVLEHLGYEVIVPPQNCCGLPMLSNGEFGAAESYHRRNVARLAPYVNACYPILGTSTSCTLTLKEEAPELLDLESDAGTRALKLATWDIFEWLRERLDQDQLPSDLRPLNQSDQPSILPYHAPCQLRAHRIGKPALDLLARIPGLDLRESQARCCGIAGTYGYKTEKYQIAMDVGAELFDYVAAQADASALLSERSVSFTACDSETCRWQLEHGTGLPSRHPIELLAAAYGLYDLHARRPAGGN